MPGVQGAASSRPRVGADLLGGQADPADQQPGGCGPPVGAVAGHCNLRAVHVDRVDPLGLGDTGQGRPQRGDALGAEGKLHVGRQRGAGQRSSRRRRAAGPARPALGRPAPRVHGAAGPRRGRRESSLPASRSAASAVAVSAQVATCGRPQRCP
ncbi:MAG: hypothetical protein ACRDRQ_22140, partial [Pseudonocardiaceae bacterium]